MRDLDLQLKKSEAATAASMKQMINGKTFWEWLGWTMPADPDIKAMNADLKDFAKIIEALETELFDQVGAIQVPRLGATKTLAFPSTDVNLLAQCLKAYSTKRYLIPNKLEKDVLALLPKIVKVWEDLDYRLGYALLKDSVIDDHAMAWFQGEARTIEVPAPSLIGALHFWVPIWTASPYTRPFTSIDKAKEYQRLLMAFGSTANGIKEDSWLPPWPTLIPFFWKAKFLLPDHRKAMSRADSTMAGCLLVAKMCGKIESLSHVEEPDFLDSETLGIWSVISKDTEAPSVIHDPLPVEHDQALEGKFHVMALWINVKNRAKATIEKGLDAAWNKHDETWKLTTTKSGVRLTNFKPWLLIGDNFYLLRLSDSWLPGDLCGFLKGNGYVKDGDDLMAVVLQEPLGITNQGISTKAQVNEIEAWVKQGEAYRLERALEVV